MKQTKRERTTQERLDKDREVARLKATGRKYTHRRLLDRALPLRRRTLIVERAFTFDPDVLRTTRRNIYLQGYWQSEKYFRDIRPMLQRDLTVKTEPDAANAAMAGRIRRVESVSLHVRRGDYVSNEVTTRVHGVMDPDYYRRAAEDLGARVRQPHFFVFSDEPQWAREHLELGHPTTVVDLNGPDRSCEDLRLMRLCRHHIIANSSFSWWGAWLSDGPDPVVIAPKRWFRESEHDTRDLIPDRWRRL